MSATELATFLPAESVVPVLQALTDRLYQCVRAIAAQLFGMGLAQRIACGDAQRAGAGSPHSTFHSSGLEKQARIAIPCCLSPRCLLIRATERRRAPR